MSPVPASCGVLTKDVVDESSGIEASSSESGTLPEDEVVPSSSLLVDPVVAPEAEACGSASAAQDEAEPRPWRTWKAESHGKWRCESADGSSRGSDSAPTLAPAARKRGATTGAALSRAGAAAAVCLSLKLRGKLSRAAVQVGRRVCSSVPPIVSPQVAFAQSLLPAAL